MSKYSGKSDLYDAMLLYGKSDDEFEAFNRFKELTNGRIIMRFPMTLTPHNIDREIELTKNSFILDKREVTRVVKDKCVKSGTPETLDASTVVSDRGESLSPK